MRPHRLKWHGPWLGVLALMAMDFVWSDQSLAVTLGFLAAAVIAFAYGVYRARIDDR